MKLTIKPRPYFGWSIQNGKYLEKQSNQPIVSDIKPHPVYGYGVKAVRVAVITEAEYKRLKRAAKHPQGRQQ